MVVLQCLGYGREKVEFDKSGNPTLQGCFIPCLYGFARSGESAAFVKDTLETLQLFVPEWVTIRETIAGDDGMCN